MSSSTSWSGSLPDVGSFGAGTFDPARVEEAVRDGYRTGFEAGRADGAAAAAAAAHEQAVAALADDRRQAAALLLALRDQVHRLADVEAEVRAGFEVAVVDAAVVLAEAIIGRELALAHDPGRDAIRRALAVAPAGCDAVVVRLHPDDHACLGPLGDLALGREVTVVADATIDRGGCRASVGAMDIDATIADALDRARAVLRDGIDAPGEPG